MEENVSKVYGKLEEVSRLVGKFNSQSEQLDALRGQLEGAYELMNELVGKFKPQSEQLASTQSLTLDSYRALKKATGTFEEKFGELERSIYATVNAQEREMREVKKSYQSAKESLESACYDFLVCADGLKSIFVEENFRELCARISELGTVLEGCKSLRDEFLSACSDTVAQIN